jgi:hypothetical protein
MTQFNGSEIVARVRREFGAYIDPSKPIGTASSFGTNTRVEKVASNTNLYEVVAFATTDGVDSVGDVVIQSGIDWNSYFTRNGSNVFVDHDYSITSRVGRVRNMKMVNTPAGGKGWLVRTGIPVNRQNPKADAVLAAAEDGSVGMSIAFEANDYGPPTADEKKAYPTARSIIRTCKVIEISFTCMPCNVECQSMAVNYDDGKSARVRELVAKSARGKLISQWLSVPATKTVLVLD